MYKEKNIILWTGLLCSQFLHLEWWENPTIALPTFFLIHVDLFCRENKRAIENSSASREYKFSSELLKILCLLNKLINLTLLKNCWAVWIFPAWNGKSVCQLSLEPLLLTTSGHSCLAVILVSISLRLNSLFNSVQFSHSVVSDSLLPQQRYLFAISACQASLSITNSRSLP